LLRETLAGACKRAEIREVCLHVPTAAVLPAARVRNAMTAPPPQQRPDDEARAAILGYLAEYPDAMDTFDGIAAWWMTRQRVRVEVERVWHVLQRLVGEGLLEEIGTGAERRYRLKRPAPGRESGGD
jgi:hypothetical protein